MRTFMVAVVVGLAMLIAPAAASAATDSVTGFEVAFTSTRATFVGKASGDVPGHWKAVVDHTPLSPNATITGGSFKLVTTTWLVIVGTFDYGGTVTRTNPGTGCTNQTYDVSDTLSNIGVGVPGTGTGSFHVVLTHKRAFVPFVGCVIYSATVAGTLTLSP
jgi:hypothetical protein